MILDAKNLPAPLRASSEEVSRRAATHAKIGLQVGQAVIVSNVWYRVHAKRKRDLVLRRLNPAEIEYAEKIARKRSQHAPSRPDP